MEHATSARGKGAVSSVVDVLQLMDRFSHRRQKASFRILAQGDTTTSFKAGDNDETMVSFSHGAGDLISGIGLTPCTDACQHNEAELDGKYRVVVRPDGLVESFTAGPDKMKLGVDVYETNVEPAPASVRSKWPSPTLLCEGCSGFDFSVLYPGIITMHTELDADGDPLIDFAALAWAAVDKPQSGDQPFHKNFAELQKSAPTCAACTVILSTLPQPETFVSDDQGSISLRVEARDDEKLLRSVWYIDVGFPAIDSRHPGCPVTRYGKLDILAPDIAHMANQHFDIVGRTVLSADDHNLASKWIENCKTHHKICQIESNKQTLPTRVIYIPEGEHGDLRLEDGDGRTCPYVALSYRWGAARLSKTLQSNISHHKTRIALPSLSKTIQDAIIMTRKLGFQYLWVDSLCIIQDSADDWRSEAARMADIYSNAALTISASVSDSADAGLFYPNVEDYMVPLHARSIEGEIIMAFSLAVRSVSSFHSDADGGTLSTRGWCLQERLLSRRILHFGASQTHWECLEGVWSASHNAKLSDGGGGDVQLRRDLQTNLRPSVPRKGRASLTNPGAPIVFEHVPHDKVSEPLTDKSDYLPPLRQLYGLEPHGTWYRTLMDYSARSLTVETDKLTALSGLASRFARATGDTYLSGLWLNGLPEGLLWSSLGIGRRTYGAVSESRIPAVRRAPSWSWASLDGPVVYASAKYGYVDAVVHAYSCPGMESRRCGGGGGDGKSKSKNSNSDMLGLNVSQRLVLKAMIKPLAELAGFAPEQRRHLLQNKDSRGAFFVPHALWDDPAYDPDDMDGVEALFIAQAGCGKQGCGHQANCDAGFAHCLLIKGIEKDERIRTHRRLGVAQCYSGDFSTGATRVFRTLV